MQKVLLNWLFEQRLQRIKEMDNCVFPHERQCVNVCARVCVRVHTTTSSYICMHMYMCISRYEKACMCMTDCMYTNAVQRRVRRSIHASITVFVSFLSVHSCTKLNLAKKCTCPHAGTTHTHTHAHTHTQSTPPPVTRTALATAARNQEGVQSPPAPPHHHLHRPNPPDFYSALIPDVVHRRCLTRQRGTHARDCEASTASSAHGTHTVYSRFQNSKMCRAGLNIVPWVSHRFPI